MIKEGECFNANNVLIFIIVSHALSNYVNLDLFQKESKLTLKKVSHNLWKRAYSILTVLT